MIFFLYVIHVHVLDCTRGTLELGSLAQLGAAMVTGALHSLRLRFL